MILGIDTSAGQCAVAVVTAEGLCGARRADRMERGHAERLMPMIDAALAEAGAAHGDLVRIGVCTGPGSFTGIRVGVSAARGLALGLGIPVIGVDRFDALAAGAEPAAVAIRGPRGTAYLRLYRGAGASRDATDRQIAIDDVPAVAGPGCLGDGMPGAPAEAGLADPALIALIAARAPENTAPPAPYYLRGPNADPPRDPAPRMLD